MKQAEMKKLARGIQRCRRCERWQTRQHAVPGAGDVDAKIVLCGEAPGKKEDAKGEPFIGRAGAYLDKVMSKNDVHRQDFYITSILKCYHPESPKKPQIKTCYEWTEKQLGVIQPKMILVMGKSAAQGFLGVERLGIAPVHKEWRGIPCIVTCHPAAAMRFPERDEQFRRDFRTMLKSRALK